MTIFKEAKNTSAFLKMGIMGKQGAGKTKTAGKVAIGLVKHLKKLGISYAHKPVMFFDTETGSDYLIPDFEAAGIPFMVAKTKTLADLLEGMKEAEANASVLIIDSITHPYRELIAAYLKMKNRTTLQIDDYQYLKGECGWAQFTGRYINSKLHIIMCGRAGDDLEQYVDENGKRQLEKIGTKMKGEAETGFEPSLLVVMELLERRERDVGVRTVKNFIHRATVVKDRWDAINGDMFEDPGFDEFLPHISRLALGGDHVGIRDTGDSQSILKIERRDWSPQQRRIVLGEIQDLLVLHVPGQATAEKQRKIGLVKKHFGVGWVEAEEVMSVEDLRQGYDSLHRELEGAPSKYTAVIAEKAKGDGRDLGDSLPDHSAAPERGPGPRDDAPLTELTLEQKLIADLPEIKTVPGLLAWAIEVTNKHRATLGEDAFNRVNVAMMARQTEVLKEQSKKPPEGDEGGDKPEPGKDDGRPPQSDAPKTDLSEVDPATGAPAFLTRQPKPDKATKPPKGKQASADADADLYAYAG